MDVLNELKTTYDQSLKGPKYPGYEVLIAETKCDIMAKGSEYLSLNQNQSS